jgi:hypothetical protein
VGCGKVYVYGDGGGGQVGIEVVRMGLARSEESVWEDRVSDPPRRSRRLFLALKWFNGFLNVSLIRERERIAER